MNKTSARHIDLRNRIIDSAEKSIAQNGSSSISARALANDVGCAVGAIYNVFSDLQSITEAVNLRTFDRMHQFVIDAIQKANRSDPKENLIMAGCAYLKFALENERLWLTIFEIEMVPIEDFPQAYLEKSDALFAIIEELVAKIYPDEEESEINCISRTFFSAVHGIVYLGVERRILSVPQENLEGMIIWLMRQVLK